jgi:hypothetical protein
MNDGKDLRNKLVSVNGNVYAIGGNNCLAEKFSIKRNEWGSLSSYQHLVSDNLDSWACALYYDMPGKPTTNPIMNEELRNSSAMMKMYHNQLAPNQYAQYQYDEAYDEEVFSEQSSIFEEWM